MLKYLVWGLCAGSFRIAAPFSDRPGNFTSKFYGQSCFSDEECDYLGSVCDLHKWTCGCRPDLPVTNKIDICAPGVALNGVCSSDAQCEYVTQNSMCSGGGVCICRGNGKPFKQTDGVIKCWGKQFGDSCNATDQCAFKGSICDPNKKSCQCEPHLTATNHIDKCGKVARVDEECTFNEQCEQMLFDTICSGGVCICRSDKTAVAGDDGIVKCIVVNKNGGEIKTDPAMIIVLSVMCLMFIIICVVLHLFSKARWRENRSIFNTPNPRLMNASLLRDAQKTERRCSKGSLRDHCCSREPSLASVRQHHSPSLESKIPFLKKESRSDMNNSSRNSQPNVETTFTSNSKSAYWF